MPNSDQCPNGCGGRPQDIKTIVDLIEKSRAEGVNLAFGKVRELRNDVYRRPGFSELGDMLDVLCDDLARLADRAPQPSGGDPR